MASATTEICPSCATPREAGQAVCANCGWVYTLAALSPARAAGDGDHFAPGQAISGGRYRILRPLSRGGMGALYLAGDQEAFGRTVVVKTLLTSLDALPPAEAQAALGRFVQEARTLAGLRYPTIPQIYSYFHDGPLACIVMEYIEGDDLSHGLSQPGAPRQGKPYPLADVLRWAVDLCKTLEYLAGMSPPVVHQDIKPANLIRDAHSGQLYLVDFGAARERPAAAPSTGTAIFGTPGYAAPEQYGGASGPPSDVYALAATLYHLATDDDPGEHPLAFPQMNRLGYFGRLIQAALVSDPGQRPTAAALRQGLEVLLSPDSARTLIAPDGEVLQGEIGLARWCERHWEQARAWLYGALPDAVERDLVQIALAEQLRGLAARHPANRDAGLDAAIARLDPQGFGAAEMLLQIIPAQIDMGRISADTPVHTQVRVHNIGRRYARATLVTPPWLVADPLADQARREALAVRSVATPPPLAFDLQPGQEIALFLAPIPPRMPGADGRDVIVLRADRQVVARAPVTGALSAQAPSAGAGAQPIHIAILIAIGLLLLLVCVSSLVFY